MANEIIVLSQLDIGGGIEYTFAALIDTTPRLVDGVVIAHTPTNRLDPWTHLLTTEEKDKLNAGTLIFETLKTGVTGEHTDAAVERQMQAKYAAVAARIRNKYDRVDALVGKRFDKRGA